MQEAEAAAEAQDHRAQEAQVVVVQARAARVRQVRLILAAEVAAEIPAQLVDPVT
jgi:hypothetical protein